MHVDGGNQVVPQDHDHRQDQGAQEQAEDRSLPGAHFFIDEGGGAAESTGGQHVHDEADDSRVADREHLHQGHHDGDDGGGQGPEEETADAHHRVLHVHLEEAGDLGQQLAEEHGHIGQGRQHGQGGDGFDGDPGTGGGDDVGVGLVVGHKKTLLYILENTLDALTSPR